jgi:hypothetical protein
MLFALCDDDLIKYINYIVSISFPKKNEKEDFKLIFIFII